MYHFQGAPPGATPPFQQPRQPQYAGYTPQPQAPPSQYAAYGAHQQTRQTPYGQYASSQQPQAPGVYSSQAHQAPGAYAFNHQPHYQQQQQTYGSNQTHQGGAPPQAITPPSTN